MNKFLILIVSIAVSTASMGLCRAQSDAPYTEGPVWTITMVRAKAGMTDVGVREIECDVTPSIDRIGIRMRPRTKIDFAVPADLPSLGMQFGTLQLHPNGDIVAMGPDHPVTGGYLQPMTVIWADRWKLAHLAPGERVRFIAQ